MWEINNHLQILTFLRAVIFGLIIIFLYDIFRAFCVNFTFNIKVIFIMDLLFCLFLFPFIFCFIISTTNGEIRGYVFFGIIIGIFIWRFTISKFNIIFWRKFFGLIFKIFTAINCKLNSIFYKLISFFSKKLKNIALILKKSRNSLKKVLKKG